MKTISKTVPLAIACISFLAMPAMAKAPYYFVDKNSNKQYVYTNPSCNGEVDKCVGFATTCNTAFYSRPYALEMGKYEMKYNGIVTIRYNRSGSSIYCNIKK